MLTSAFRAFGGEELVKEFLTGLPGGFWGQFIIVMAVIFVLGFFLDFIEIAVVVVPIVAPILLLNPEANITAVWLGVMIGLNIQTSFLTPPFGFALFYLRGVAPPIVKTIQMYKGVIPFIALQLLALVIVGLVPSFVNYLPNRVSLTAETAPPPKNPRLQVCIEEYVGEQFATREGEIKSAIMRARDWDLSYVPADIRRDLEKAFDNAEKTFGAYAAAETTAAAIEEAAVPYRPLHRSVRAIQADIRDHEKEIKEFETLLRQSRDTDENAEENKKRYADSIERLTAEKAELEASIPADWEPRHKEFVKVLATDKKARLTYRRTADQSYEPIQKFEVILSDAAPLAAAREELTSLANSLAGLENKAASDAIKDVSSIIGKVSESSDIRKPLSDARRMFRGDNVADLTDVNALIAQSLRLLDEDGAWRQRAESELLPDVRAYMAALSDTIGLRLQERFPRHVALDVAACNADHRDISLYF